MRPEGTDVIPFVSLYTYVSNTEPREGEPDQLGSRRADPRRISEMGHFGDG